MCVAKTHRIIAFAPLPPDDEAAHARAAARAHNLRSPDIE